jgi:hypothetical protein
VLLVTEFYGVSRLTSVRPTFWTSRPISDATNRRSSYATMIFFRRSCVLTMKTCDRRRDATTIYVLTICVLKISVPTISARFPSVHRNACGRMMTCDRCSTCDHRSCVRRIRTATSFSHPANYWTSWLQPLEYSVMEGS